MGFKKKPQKPSFKWFLDELKVLCFKENGSITFLGVIVISSVTFMALMVISWLIMGLTGWWCS